MGGGTREAGWHRKQGKRKKRREGKWKLNFVKKKRRGDGLEEGLRR